MNRLNGLQRMKVAILCLAAVLLTAATQPPNHATMLPRKLAVEWRLADEWRIWLSVINENARDFPKEGWHPSYTRVLSHYKPIPKKVGENQWEITFTSEIAEDLP